MQINNSKDNEISQSIQASFSSNIYFKVNQILFLKLKKITDSYRRQCLVKIRSDNELMKWIDQQLPLLKDPCYKLSTKVSWILQGLTDFPLCKTCHKRDGYFGKNVQTFSKYNKHCSVKCTNADKELSSARTAKAIQTCLKKYGKTTFLQTSESRQKAVSTFIEKYGKDYLKSFKKF